MGPLDLTLVLSTPTVLIAWLLTHKGLDRWLPCTETLTLLPVVVGIWIVLVVLLRLKPDDAVPLIGIKWTAICITAVKHCYVIVVLNHCQSSCEHLISAMV
tara:strand:- start:161 stop:463 length:303 start_codon:yes stop_codon:yes gene_type:complete